MKTFQRIAGAFIYLTIAIIVFFVTDFLSNFLGDSLVHLSLGQLGDDAASSTAAFVDFAGCAATAAVFGIEGGIDAASVAAGLS